MKIRKIRTKETRSVMRAAAQHRKLIVKTFGKNDRDYAGRKLTTNRIAEAFTQQGAVRLGQHVASVKGPFSKQSQKRQADRIKSVAKGRIRKITLKAISGDRNVGKRITYPRNFGPSGQDASITGITAGKAGGRAGFGR